MTKIFCKDFIVCNMSSQYKSKNVFNAKKVHASHTTPLKSMSNYLNISSECHRFLKKARPKR